MLLKRQILSWISIIVFFTSTTGMSVYEHICHSSNSKSVSLSQLACDSTEKSDDCCSGESNHDECCDVGVSFEKYIPNGKTESHYFAYEILLLKALPVNYNWNEWIQNPYTLDVKVLANPPNPHVSQPKTVSERLSFIQSYLC